MSEYDTVLSMSVPEYEKERDNILKSYKNVENKLTEIQSDEKANFKLQSDINSLKCDDLFSQLDAVAFLNLNINVSEKENSGNLFGNISEVVETAIKNEVNEIAANKNLSKHATPELLIMYDNSEYSDIISNDILEKNKDNGLKNIFITRCMEVYNQTAKTTNVSSEETKKKINENNKIIYAVGKNYVPNPNLSEAHLGEAVSYTIAVASNLKDGTVPDISKYKENIKDSINSALNTLVKSKDISATVNSFDITVNSLSKCKQQMQNIPKTEDFRKAIGAIEDLCHSKLKETQKIINNQNNLEM